MSIKKLVHDQKKIELTQKITKRVSLVAESRIIVENKEVRVLLEALDAAAVKTIVDAISTIKTLTDPVSSKVPILANALTLASAEARKELTGGAGQAVANLFKIAKPVAELVSFIGALKGGFAQIPQLIKLLNAPNDIDKTKSLLELIPDPQVQTQANKLFQKALTPPGAFATIKSIFGSSGIPFVKDSSALAHELLSLPYETLESFSAKMNTIKVPINPADLKTISDDAKLASQNKADPASPGGAAAPASPEDAAKAATAEKAAGAPVAGPVAPGQKIGNDQLNKWLGSITKNIGSVMGIPNMTPDQQAKLAKVLAYSLKNNFKDQFQ